MGTTAEKLNYLLETKEQIKQAIKGKGIEVPENEPFRNYPKLIEQVAGSAATPTEIDLTNPLDMGNLYAGFDPYTASLAIGENGNIDFGYGVALLFSSSNGSTGTVTLNGSHLELSSNVAETEEEA